MATPREVATRLVMLLGVHEPEQLRWLRALVVGEGAPDADLVEALVRDPCSVPRVLSEARLVARDVSVFGGFTGGGGR